MFWILFKKALEECQNSRGNDMDQVTSFFISEFDNILNIGFICNLMIFSACFEAISVAIGHFASMGK